MRSRRQSITTRVKSLSYPTAADSYRLLPFYVFFIQIKAFAVKLLEKLISQSTCMYVRVK